MILPARRAEPFTRTLVQQHILLAEDDQAVRVFVTRALSHAGYDVIAVRDGIEAIETLVSGGRFDLLVTDIVMPGLDGIGLALRVTKEYPELPILLMTGYAAERQRAHNLDTLVHRVVGKPFTLREICDAVAMTLRERQRNS